MPHRLIPLIEHPMVTFLLTTFLMITWWSVLAVLAQLVVIVRGLYLIKRDIMKNHNGSLKSWFKYCLKKN